MKDLYAELAKALNVAEITNNYSHNNHDLEISEWMTADGYAIHVMTNDSNNLQFDYDIFYNIPHFDDIIERIKELHDEDSIVFIDDFETYLPEYEVENYLEQLQVEHEA